MSSGTCTPSSTMAAYHNMAPQGEPCKFFLCRGRIDIENYRTHRLHLLNFVY